MVVIQILSFFILILFLSYVFQERIVDVLPVGGCLLVLFLVILSFAGNLSFLDIINTGVLLCSLIYFMTRPSEKRSHLLQYFKKELSHPGVLIALITIVLVTVFVSAKVVTWWDDYNFWATDVKSLFYLDGFAGKYKNVAPEFGDYPPGAQMMKWWFLHLQPGEFREGLMFAGYYVFNFLFLFPILRRLPGKSPLLFILCPIFLWMFPSVAEGFYLTGTCADLTMAVIYGAFLSSVLDDPGHSRLFYYGRLTLYLMVLVLVKNVGFLWAAFAILFFLLYHIYQKRKHWLGIGCTICLPVLTFGGWMTFCFFMRRVAKLTGAAVQMAAKGVSLPASAKELAETFASTFVSFPLHRWKTWGIDLTPLALFLLICFFIFLLYKKGIVEKKMAVIIGGYTVFSGLVFYGINLISHLTIFAVEEQYLEPFNMVSSIERYGAPFTVGSLSFLIFLCLQQRKEEGVTHKKWMAWILVFLLVFLCVDHKMVYEGIYGYREDVAAQLADRDEIVGEKAKGFLQKLQSSEEVKHACVSRGMRVLYLRDGTTPHWVNNTYIGYEASPVSVMFGSIVPNEAEETSIYQKVKETHAQYLYADELGETDLAVFGSMTLSNTFQYGTLYQINWEADKMTLIEAK